MTRRSTLWVPLLAGCIGLPPAPPQDEETGSTHGMDPPSSTQGTTTTAPTPGDTTSEPSTTTAISTDVTTSIDPSTDSSSSSGPPPSCQSDDDCGSNQSCSDRGECESICLAGWSMGTYDYCLDQWGGFDIQNACGGTSPDRRCIYWGDPIEAAVCSTQNCATACDCPAPPATGNATVTCGDISPSDAIPDCYLSCANEETCPDGMVCRNDEYCAHEPSPLPMYGNCDGVDAPCAVGDCLYYMPGHSICMAGCNNPGDCDPAPPSSDFNSDCDSVAQFPAGPECYIPCNNNGDCPPDMECLLSLLCLWPDSWPN